MLKIFYASLSAIESHTIMTKNKDLVFLVKKGLNKALDFFHLLEVSGGTVVNPEEDCDFILVLNQNNAIVVTPNIGSVFKTLHQDAYKVADRADIMNCASVEDIENLQDRDSQTIHAKNSIAVPPFLIRTVSVLIVANKVDTGKIFLDVIKDIKEFDKLHKDDASFTEKSATKCK